MIRIGECHHVVLLYPPGSVLSITQIKHDLHVRSTMNSECTNREGALRENITKLQLQQNIYYSRI